MGRRYFLFLHPLFFFREETFHRSTEFSPWKNSSYFFLRQNWVTCSTGNQSLAREQWGYHAWFRLEQLWHVATILNKVRVLLARWQRSTAVGQVITSSAMEMQRLVSGNIFLPDVNLHKDKPSLWLNTEKESLTDLLKSDVELWTTILCFFLFDIEVKFNIQKPHRLKLKLGRRVIWSINNS